MPVTWLPFPPAPLTPLNAAKDYPFWPSSLTGCYCDVFNSTCAAANKGPLSQYNGMKCFGTQQCNNGTWAQAADGKMVPAPACLDGYGTYDASKCCGLNGGICQSDSKATYAGGLCLAKNPGSTDYQFCREQYQPPVLPAKPTTSTCSAGPANISQHINNDLNCPQEKCYGDTSCCFTTGACLDSSANNCIWAEQCGGQGNKGGKNKGNVHGYACGTPMGKFLVAAPPKFNMDNTLSTDYGAPVNFLPFPKISNNKMINKNMGTKNGCFCSYNKTCAAHNRHRRYGDWPGMKCWGVQKCDPSRAATGPPASSAAPTPAAAR